MQQRQREILIAPLLEGLLILVMGLAGYFSHNPLVFAALGPTAYEMVETPERRSARPYSIILGHAIAVLAAFAALWLSHAWSVSPVSASGVPLPRVWAMTMAAALTVLGTLLARATQPAALSTTLLVSAGVMQTLKDGAVIMIAVLLITAVGEPIRHMREKNRQHE